MVTDVKLYRRNGTIDFSRSKLALMWVRNRLGATDATNCLPKQ